MECDFSEEKIRVGVRLMSVRARRPLRTYLLLLGENSVHMNLLYAILRCHFKAGICSHRLPSNQFYLFFLQLLPGSES